MRFIFLLIASCLCAQNSNNYLGPNRPTTGTVDTQVIIYDEKNPSGVQITNVTFNGINIPLRPRDINGFRGQGSFKLLPGKYKMQWTVQRSTMSWPRTLTYKEEVTISPRDLWIQIKIEGANATLL
jgi:hypothetical protein